MKTRKKIFITTFLIVILGIIALFSIYTIRKIENKKIPVSEVVTSECIPLTPVNTIYFEDINLDDFTCTGITYDTDTLSWWIADHGSEADDNLRIVQIDKDFSKVISISEIGDLKVKDCSLQGITYDNRNNTLWIATGNYVYEIDKTGNIITELSNDLFSDYQSNGLCYDNTDDSLWILCYSRYLVHMTKSGDILDKISCKYADQDMIYKSGDSIYITAGADYHGDHNYCIMYDTVNKSFTVKYQLLNSYAVEGIYTVNNTMYIVNDGLYHDTNIKKSYISVYNY